MKIVFAKNKQEIAAVHRLFREYENFLNVDLCIQQFEAELASLPGKYAPPDGALFLAMDPETAAGCVGLRKIDTGVCEMKRLFVKPGFRGKGAGRMLAEEIIREAKKLGYKKMRLDTMDWLKEAVRLYESLGFQPIHPYYHNPISGAAFWELNL